MDAIFQIFMMLGGLAVFMYGMKIMGDSLENLAGDKVKTMFGKVSGSKLKGIGIGLGVTAIIQSSSATTVMLVGFVNIGVLTLTQSAAIIMGSNIGTTVTAQLSSLSALNITALMSLVAFIGMALVMFSKKESKQKLGIILLGLGMLFIGLSLMSGSMKSFALDSAGNPTPFAEFMLSSFTNPFVNILCGALFTAVIQSSSAATGILITFASAGVINFDTAMFMILGTNIGTCITAIIASIGTSTNAKRAAGIHLLFNVIGTVIMIGPFLLFRDQISRGLMAMSGGVLERAIANFHTIFNIVVTAVLYPFMGMLVKLSTFLIKEKVVTDTAPTRLYYLDQRMLQAPAIAVSQVVSEVDNMGSIAKVNLKWSLDMIAKSDLSRESEVKENEKTLNYLNKEITKYLIKISALNISEKDSKVVGSLFHVVSDIERIGDYAENAMQFARKMKEEGIVFSEKANEEIIDLQEKLMKMHDSVMEVFTKRDTSLIPDIEKMEEEIDEIKDLMENMHIERLNEGKCTVVAGSIYLSLASQLERVADHMLNIAYSVKRQKYKKK